MLTRREAMALLTRGAAGLAMLSPGCSRIGGGRTATLVNDIHSQLNPTHVDRVARIDSLGALQTAVRDSRARGKRISIAGGRHAMGGQQFGTDTLLLDTRPLNRVLSFDRRAGLVEVEAGIQWPELIEWLIETQAGAPSQWAIVQKQTGADRLTIGGALSANIHGRGLSWKPMVGDVESFTIMDASGEVRTCSRNEHSELFRTAIGGYGLFGIVTSVKLRLMPRTKLERVVRIVDVNELMSAVQERIAEGYIYGDCQVSIDPKSDGFLQEGVFSCYRPVAMDTPIPAIQKTLSEDDWRELLQLAHTDPNRVFERYSSYYLSTSGQTYWSDTHQLSTYLDDYHREVDRRTGGGSRATEMITEVYVPHDALPRFIHALREDFRKFEVKLIYGTIRMIEKDDETFLPWAKNRYVCLVMNLHVAHDRGSVQKAAGDFRRVIDRAIEHGGSYYLTYHRWASRTQVETCYPQFVEFLELKRKYDPGSTFESEWYRHYREMFS